MRHLLLDLRLTLRSLRVRPGFTGLVVLTLALTIGAVAAVFSLFDAVLLRPFPYDDPARLVRLRTFQAGVADDVRDASIEDLRDWRRRARSFTGMAAWVSFANNLTGMGPARAVRMTFTTPELFGLLGVTPIAGRTFTAAEDAIGGDVRQAVLGHGLWQELFAGEPGARRDDVLGRTIQLRGEPYTIIGVLPPAFDYPDRTEVWVPLMARYASYPDDWWKKRDVRIHSVLARLKPGISLAQASSDMRGVAAALGAAYPDTDRDIGVRVLPLRDAEAGALAPYILLVGGAVALLLILGCVNVAGLFIARAAARGREMAVRAALGAQTHHLVRQLLVESGLYALLGGAGGLLLAFCAVRLLDRLVPVDLPAWMQFGLDARVLAFTLAVTMGMALLVGLAPLAQTWRLDPNDALRRGGGGKGAGAAGASARVRRVLIVVEVALSVSLLVGAGLMLRSFARLMAVDTGVRAERTLIASVGRYLPRATKQEMLVGYADEFRRMREALSALPGVRFVSGGSEVPYLDQPEQRRNYELYTRRRATREQAYRGPAQGADVLPGYFRSLGIPLLAGRDFTEADTLGSPPVIVISARAARTLFPGEPAVGQEIRWGTDAEYDPWTTVVGVVADTRWQPAERTAGLETYWPLRQFPGPTLQFVIETTGEPEPLASSVRRTLQAVNPEFSIRRVEPLTTIRAASVWQRRLWGFLLGTFAVLALSLTAVGLYGVMSYLVIQRTREIGIRMAIGAARGRIVRLVLWHGLALTMVGVAGGLLAAAGASRFMGSVLFELSALDPVTFVCAPLVLGLVAIAACALPAWRASRVDPLTALRQEL